MKKEIITKRLRLSAIREEDKADLIRILSEPEVGKTYMVPDMSGKETQDKLFDRFRDLSQSDDRFMYGIFLQNRLIGFIHEVYSKDGEVELGYVIDPAHKGNGYASEALAASVKALFGKGYKAVTAGAFEENPASLRVMEKCGMKPTGQTEDIEYRGTTHKCVYMRVEDKTNYPLSEKYDTPYFMSKIMGPNPLKLEEELLTDNLIEKGSTVCDLGSGQGLTSIFLVKEYGFKVYAADLWSDPEQNRLFFRENGLTDEQIIPVKADAEALPFDKEFFDAVVSTDSYNYFGRDPEYLDNKLLPFVKAGGYIYVAVPGMKKDCHNDLPPVLLLSWTPEQLETMHDKEFWYDTVSQCRGAEVTEVSEMESNDEVWADWLKQDNEYAVGDRKTMEAGGGKYLNFIKIVLKKK